MSHRLRNETAVTVFSLGVGFASGVAALVLANRMKEKQSTHTNSVVGITILIASLTIAGAYLIKLSEEEPHLP